MAGMFEVVSVYWSTEVENWGWKVKANNFVGVWANVVVG